MANWIRNLIKSIRSSNYKYQIGDIIEIVNDDFLYYNYHVMAIKMKLPNWTRGYYPCIGDLGTVIARDIHPHYKSNVYAIQTDDGTQYLMGEIGISL